MPGSVTALTIPATASRRLIAILRGSVINRNFARFEDDLADFVALDRAKHRFYAVLWNWPDFWTRCVEITRQRMPSTLPMTSGQLAKRNLRGLGINPDW
jgi:hypothetical protein